MPGVKAEVCSTRLFYARIYLGVGVLKQMQLDLHAARKETLWRRKLEN